MDPNEALTRIREGIAEFRRQVDLDNEFDALTQADAMAEHIEALDEWLSKDGFLPDDWRSDDEKNATLCRCGTPLLWAEDHWQHDRAPYVWGDDHEAVPA